MDSEIEREQPLEACAGELVSALPQVMGNAAAETSAAISLWYSQLTPLRPFVATFLPFLDAFLGTHGQNIATRRLQRTLEEMRRQFEDVDENKVDRRYLESGTFHDLLFSTFAKSQKTERKEKVSLYIRVLRQSVLGSSRRRYAQEYQDLIDGLSMPEVRVASAVFRRWGNVKRRMWSPSEAVFGRHYGLSYDEAAIDLRWVAHELPDLRDSIGIYLTRLTRTGLIHHVSGTAARMNRYLKLESEYREAYYVTDYFRGMMGFLGKSNLLGDRAGQGDEQVMEASDRQEDDEMTSHQESKVSAAERLDILEDAILESDIEECSKMELVRHVVALREETAQLTNNAMHLRLQVAKAIFADPHPELQALLIKFTTEVGFETVVDATDEELQRLFSENVAAAIQCDRLYLYTVRLFGLAVGDQRAMKLTDKGISYLKAHAKQRLHPRL